MNTTNQKQASQLHSQNDLQNMPLDMSLGPVMLDVAGLQLEEEDITRLLHPLVGGVILFARNYESSQQVSALIESIKALRSPQLLIAVDQEGGRVQRFKDGFTALPAAASFGVAWNENKQTAPMKAFKSAFTMASELLAVGVDFSFAPVFDIATVESKVIGDRSFHQEPEPATDLLGAYIDGMHAAGMVCIAKHFPGHGGVADDSHVCLPKDQRSFQEIEECDLQPYFALSDEVQGVMTSHVIYAECCEFIPAHSEFWLKSVLREKIGFEGVIFSDDLSMQGAVDVSEDIVDCAVKCLHAGCDMVLVCNSPEKADELLQGLLNHDQPSSIKQTSGTLSFRLNQLRSKCYK